MTAELEELTRFCEMTYGVPPLETRILVGALLPTRYPPLWLMVSSVKNQFLEDFAWTTRQMDAIDVWDTWFYRGERPRYHNYQVMNRMATRETKPCFFADRFWPLPAPPVLRQSRYPLLAQECVRMRHSYNPTVVTEYKTRKALQDRIHLALAAVATDRGGVVPVEPPAKWKEDFNRRLQLLPLVEKYLVNPPALARNLCFVASNHAVLCGRRQIEETDMRAVAFVMRSIVPAWMERIISVMLAYSPNASSLKMIITDTRMDDAWRNLGSRQNPLRLGEKLVVELWMSGVIDKTSKGKWKLKPEYYGDLTKILNAQL